MSPINKQSRSVLSEQFADIFQQAQQEYRSLLGDLRDDDIDINVFTERAETLHDHLIKLKRIRLQLRYERDELARIARETGAMADGGAGSHLSNMS